MPPVIEYSVTGGKGRGMRNIFAKYREIILGLLILILLAVSWLLYARTLKNDFQNEIISSLEEVSTQGENILEKEINAKLELLTEVSRRVSFYPAEDYEEAASMLAATAMENDFKRMGIISADGKTYTTDHVQMDLSDRPYYKKAMEGRNACPILSGTGKGMKRFMFMQSLCTMRIR